MSRLSIVGARSLEGENALSREGGMILILTLMFLALLGMLSGTVMQTSVLELRMARNHQFQLEAFQHAQGVASAISQDIDNFLVSGKLNHMICKDVKNTPGCSANVAVPNPNLVTVPAGVTMDYRVRRVSPLLQKGFPVRLGEGRVSSSVSYDAAVFETQVEIDATSVGQGAAKIALGVAVLAVSSD